MSAFLPIDHVFVEHEYSAGNWQDVTGVVSLVLNLREFEGQHTAGLTLFNATLDPAQGTGTRILKQGDRVRVSMHNAAATVRRTGTFVVKRVATAIDLKKPPGRQYLVTLELRGNGIAGVAGVGASKGVDTIDDLSDVITGAPFEIGGDGYGSGRTTPIGTSTEVAVTEVASELDQVLITKDSNPGVMAFEDPYGTVQVFDSRTQRTGAATLTLGPGQYSDIDVSFDTTHVINVVHIKYLEKIKPAGAGAAGKATKVKEHDVTFTTNDGWASAKFYADSIPRYGRRAPAKPHVVHKKSNFQDYADDVFTANAWPDEVPRSVTVPIRKASELLGGYEDGHYVTKKVDVVSPDGLTTWTCRISRIQHTISNRRWVAQVFLRPPTAVKHRKAPKVTEVGNNVDGTILTDHLEDEAVTSDKVTPKAITEALIDDEAVTVRTVGGSDFGLYVDSIGAAATTAQATADGKNSVTYSSTIPSGTPDDGDIWFKITAGVIVGQWVGNAGAWQSVTIGSLVIANLDAGKITSGTLTSVTITGVTIISPTIETATSGSRCIIQDDPTGGLITFFLGIAGETFPGLINPGSSSGHPQLGMRCGTTATNGIAPGILMQSGRNAAGQFPFLSLDPGSFGSVVIGSAWSVTQAGAQICASLQTTGNLQVNGTADVSNAVTAHAAIHSTTGGLFMDDLTGGGSTGASIGNSGRITRTTSSRRYKYNIRPLGVTQARQVVGDLAAAAATFKRKKHDSATPADPRRYGGAIAEELAQGDHAEPWVIRDTDGRPDGIHYAELVAPVAVVVDDHDTRLEALEAEVERLRSTLETYISLGRPTP